MGVATGMFPWIMDQWTHGSMDPWDPWIPWIHGSMNHGSMDPWIHESMDPWPWEMGPIQKIEIIIPQVPETGRRATQIAENESKLIGIAVEPQNRGSGPNI